MYGAALFPMSALCDSFSIGMTKICFKAGTPTCPEALSDELPVGVP